ncbi:MAG: Spy/CpxP family protein refolding chaperone [Endomicrobiales bacterium]|nr:Spy/CpxP family protein refolding chaperone [Endomicrobiales bacterium]
MFNKDLVKLVLAVFVISVVAIGSGICADVVNQDAKKTDVMSKMSTRNAIRFSKEIGLSDKQQEKIKAIQKQSRESMQAFMTDSKSKREELNLVTKSTDIAVKIKAQSEFADVSKQLIDMRMTEANKIVAVLSAEQKAKLVELSDADMRNAVEKMKVKTQEKPVVEQKK